MKYAIHMVGKDGSEWDDLTFESDRPGPVRDFITRIQKEQEKHPDGKWANVEHMYVAYMRDQREVQTMHQRWEQKVDEHGTRATFKLIRPVIMQHSRYRTLSKHPALALLPPQGQEGVKNGEIQQVRYFANRLMNVLLTMLDVGSPLPARVGRAEDSDWQKRVQQLDHYFEVELYISG